MKFISPRGWLTGMASTIPIGIAVHETGHYLGAKAVGGNPEYALGFNEGLKGPAFRVLYHFSERSDFNIMVGNIGGPVAEYSVVLGLAYLGRQLDRTKHRALKEGSKSLSCFMSWVPAVSSIGTLVTKGGDYQKMDNLGLPLYATIPATFLLGAAITYYNLKEKVPVLGDNITEVQKKEIIERFVQRINEIDYEPSLLDKLSGKIKRKSPLEVKADNLYRELSNSEVFEDNEVSVSRRLMNKLSYILGSEEDIMEFINYYLSNLSRKGTAETS